MTSRTRSTTTTALAVAITAALFAAPSFAALKAPATGKPGQSQKGVAKAPVFSKPGQAYGTNLKAPSEDQFDSFIISFRKGAKPAADLQRQLDSIGRQLGARIAIDRTLGTGARLVRIDRPIDIGERKRLEAALMEHPDIRAVEPNGKLYRAFEPNDPMFQQQWHYQGDGMGINATEAWDTADGEGVVIAVLDTGQVEHADLAGQFVAGYDFISDPNNARDGDGYDPDPTDEGDWDSKYDSSWHGTHVAGTIAALTDNNLGVAGVAHGAKVQHVRVLGNAGGAFADINDAIIWASGGSIPNVPVNPTPAKVINMSLGGSVACPTDMQDAIDLAIDNGSMVVVAAGNSNMDISGYAPAGCEGVVVVAGTGPDNTKYARTNFGAGITVAAPAGSGVLPEENQVLSTLNTGATVQADDSYAWYAGTSMAAPHVAGTAALVLSVNDELTGDEVTEILRNTAWASNETVDGCDTTSRWCSSLIDAGYAVAVAAGDEPLPPAPPPPPLPPPPVPLQNGVAVEVGSMSAGTDRFYTLEIPAGQAVASFDLVPGAGATGDSDIYVRRGAAPTDATYDCRPWTSGVVAENCSFTNPQAGTWYVRVVAYTTSEGYTIEGEYGGEAPPPPPPPPPPPTIELDNGVAVDLGSMAAAEQKFFVLDVPEDATEVEFVMSPGAGATGDSDLYVQFGEHPTGTLWQCRPFSGGVVEEVCSFSPAQAGQYFVRINAWSASSGYSLTGTHDGGDVGGLPPTGLRAPYAFALKGQRVRVPLYWNGGGDQVDVRFNGEAAVTIGNTGSYVHNFTAEALGAGSATYQVCNAGTSECSETITVEFTARR